MHYRYPYHTRFPDQAYLEELVASERQTFEASYSPLERLITYSGAAMNWVSDFILDPGVSWEKTVLAIDELYLTGTTPEWNTIIIEKANRNPHLLREIIASQPEVKMLFSTAKWSNKPILVRREEQKNKVFNGMHRVVAAICDGRTEISAFVGELTASSYQPVCEPHVVYDLLRAYIRQINPDRDGLITALRFLRKSYANVDALLHHRFNISGIPDPEIQKIIQETLQD